MDDDGLLINWLYRQTFKKGSRDPDLRRTLRDARRCILSDNMAAFLYTLMIEIYAAGTPGGPGGRHWVRRYHGRLDDCRHFSRLPHPLTWVEYAIVPMLQRENDFKDSKGLPEARNDLDAIRGINSRIGWLFRQHPTIETAVQADYFIGVSEAQRSLVHLSPLSYVWCTDDEPLPWTDRIPQVDGESASAFATGASGYNRFNVGVRPNGRGDRFKFSKSSPGRARMMWAFLSTFNKIPAVGSTHIVPAHGFVAQGGYHRFLDYKVLNINVPEKRVRVIARNALASIRRKAHLVRGHWRDDWHLPRGNKALWIAEHQRGDASLGFVTHDYRVTHEQD